MSLPNHILLDQYWNVKQNEISSCTRIGTADVLLTKVLISNRILKHIHDNGSKDILEWLVHANIIISCAMLWGRRDLIIFIFLQIYQIR